MSETSYVIYKDSIFLRKIDNGFEIAEDYTGTVRTDINLPDIDAINKLLKLAGKPFKGKRDRFILVKLGDSYEALPGWGVVSANLNLRERSRDTVEFLLQQDNVEAIMFITDEGDIEYARVSKES